MILYSAYSFSFFTLFPGVDALMPTVGALMIILSGASLPARWLLSNAAMVWLGRLSYSVYLVHWPFIVLYRYAFGTHLTLPDQALLAGGSLALATVLNRAVEMRFRLAPGDQVTRSGMEASRSFKLTGLVMAGVCGLALAGITGAGWPARMPVDVREMANQDLKISAQHKTVLSDHCATRTGVFCGEQNAGGKDILLLADSRALDLYSALRTAYPGYNIRTSYALGCAPVLDPAWSESRFYGDCPRLNRERLQAAIDAPAGTIVFLAMDLSGWRAAPAVKTARRLVKSGKRVYLLGQSQFLEGKTPRDIAVDQHRWSWSEGYMERFLARTPFHLDARLEPDIASVGATYISNHDFFRHDHYRLYTEDGGDLLTYDGKHFTPGGTEEFGRYLAQRYPLE